MQMPFRLPPMEQTELRQGDLLLRPLRPADAQALHEAGQVPDIDRYTSIEWPFAPAAAERLIEAALRDWSAGAAARSAVIDQPKTPVPLFAGTARLLHIYPER